MYECHSIEESASVRMTDAHMMYECHSVEGSASVRILRCAQDDRGAGRIAPAPLAGKVSLEIDCIGSRQCCYGNNKPDQHTVFGCIQPGKDLRRVRK